MFKCCEQFSVSMLEWFLGQISLPHPLCMSTIVRMLIVMCSFGIKVGLK